jgi:predicted protein tyrosine phosphatase
MMNRLANCHNKYQGQYKKVLCVCSAGLLRSPTTAYVLANEFDCNTRAAGLTTEYALIPVDRVLIEWADEIVCMDESQAEKLRTLYGTDKPIISLNIPDQFQYRDPELIELIRKAYKEIK